MMHVFEILLPASRAGAVVLLSAVALGAAPGALGANEAATGDTPPVLLRSTLFITPVEAAGTGLAPEVSVRLTVDERGRVSDPEVLSITPSSHYDGLFRDAVLETLESWRYAPATRDGEPVVATLEWMVQFLPRSRRGADSGPTAEDEAWRLKRVFALPPDRQEERLHNFSSIAERWLDPEQRRRADSARFVVISDSPGEEAASTIAGNLEAVFHVLDGVFRDDIEPQPTDYKLIVYLYAREASFQGMGSELAAAEWATGLYMPPGLFGFHLEVDHVDRVLVTMIHEAVHAYVDRHLAHPGFRPPPWVSEGLAEYFAKSEIVKGELVPGRIREGKYVVDAVRGGAYRRTTSAGWSLDEAQQAVRAGRAASVADLVGGGRESFYGDEISMHYALSWLLIHYLRHGEPEWAEREFPAFLLYVLEGYPAEEALEEVYGKTPRQMEDAFRDHVRSL